MIPVRYLDAAEQELLDEVAYLEDRSTGLGARFLAEVRRLEEFIQQFPETPAQIAPGVHRKALRQFRYSLVYTVEPDCLLVLAVAHSSRRPGYWLPRLNP